MAKRVLPVEAADLIRQGWVYLDVRSIPEFAAGHPVGAANIPLLHAGPGRMLPNPDFQRVVGATYPKDTRLVIGCKSGSRSRQAAALLGAVGYTQVVDMGGGFSGERDGLGRVTCAGWAESGLPTATVAEAGKSYAELSAPIIPR